MSKTTLAGLERLADLMDTRFKIPGIPFRFGLDPLIGLIPGVGDAAGVILSSAMLIEAKRRGLPRAALTRMARNMALELLVGSIPGIGDAFDFWFRSNRRNLKILTEGIASQQRGGPSPTTPSGDGRAVEETS